MSTFVVLEFETPDEARQFAAGLDPRTHAPLVLDSRRYPDDPTTEIKATVWGAVGKTIRSQTPEFDMVSLNAARPRRQR
jgi:hypothetical protein